MGNSQGFARKHLLDRNTISTLAVAIAMVVASPAYADQGDASLQGHVDGVSAGTQVVVVDTVTGHKTIGTVDAKGNYQILGLRP